MTVSIMMAGPIGALGGRIEVRRYVEKCLPDAFFRAKFHVSIHSGGLKGSEKTWPEVDAMGFRKAEESMSKFALQVFGKPLSYEV